MKVGIIRDNRNNHAEPGINKMMTEKELILDILGESELIPLSIKVDDGENHVYFNGDIVYFGETPSAAGITECVRPFYEREKVEKLTDAPTADETAELCSKERETFQNLAEEVSDPEIKSQVDGPDIIREFETQQEIMCVLELQLQVLGLTEKVNLAQTRRSEGMGSL